jgi:predicted nucleic acid-binding protein
MNATLVDTSVWSMALRRDQRKLNPRENRSVSFLRFLVEEDLSRVIGPIRQEILSGVREIAQFEKLREQMRGFEDEPLLTADFELAAELSLRGRRAGIVASSVDILICAVAQTRNWSILSLDYDFERLANLFALEVHLLE